MVKKGCGLEGVRWRRVLLLRARVRISRSVGPVVAAKAAMVSRCGSELERSCLPRRGLVDFDGVVAKSEEEEEASLVCISRGVMMSGCECECTCEMTRLVIFLAVVAGVEHTGV